MTLATYRCPGCKRRHYGRNYWSDKPQPDHYCQDCHEFSKPEAVDSTRGLRCPMCGEVEEDDLYEISGLYEEGSSEVSCPSCEFDYRISTAIEITFSSPERITIHHGDSTCDEDTWMPTGDATHRFHCVDCNRWCCACFGHDEEAAASEIGEGVCNDCWVVRKK